MTYRQQWICCRRCPRQPCQHGPYWYLEYRKSGRVKTQYIGKRLPAGVQPGMDSSPATTPASTEMTVAGAFRLLRLKRTDTYLVGHMRWETERKWLARQGDAKRVEMVAWNRAWEIVGPLLKG